MSPCCMDGSGGCEMKVSEVIRELERFLEVVGDVELHKEVDDGRSTHAERYNIKFNYGKIWKGHSDPPQWYIK